MVLCVASPLGTHSHVKRAPQIQYHPNVFDKLEYNRKVGEFRRDRNALYAEFSDLSPLQVRTNKGKYNFKTMVDYFKFLLAKVHRVVPC